jgi:hypothetical protein
LQASISPIQARFLEKTATLGESTISALYLEIGKFAKVTASIRLNSKALARIAGGTASPCPL